MNIVVVATNMSYLSGSPLYNYELCKELRSRGHTVTMVSDWNRDLLLAEDGKKLKENLEADGIGCVNFDSTLSSPDVIFASEPTSREFIQRYPNVPVVNIIHSEYECEDPLPNNDQIIAYVCIRYSIMNHIISEHNIPEHKCVVIYNGVDRKRFKPVKQTKRNYYKVVVPCTIDRLREPFLNHLIDGANEKKRIFIFGADSGGQLHKSDWVTIAPPKFDIQEDIADCDEVAGILIGRVNLEAWSCGVPSRVYDPITLENKLYPVPVDFDEMHNIKNVVDKLMDVVGNLDRITVVIPHHSARPQLARLMESIKNMKYVRIIKGGTFAHNCNVGVKASDTEFVLITNDDTTFSPQTLLRQMMYATKDADVIGATPNQGVRGFDIIDRRLVQTEHGHYPSGALLLIKKSVFDKLGGFDERYKNGAEDIHLFLQAEKMGYKVKRIDAEYMHEESQSEGRFDHVDYNIKIFNKEWKGVCSIGL